VIRSVKKRAVPEAHRAHRVTVIPRAERKKHAPLPFPALPPRLVDHLQPRLDCRRSIVGKKHAPALRLILSRERTQQFERKPRRDIIRQPEE